MVNTAPSAIGTSSIIKKRRGRPKTKDDSLPVEKLMDKIVAATNRSPGQPTVYASTTKGGMKMIYDGHHFRYSFRKGQYSIFQCCYKENKEECKVRVVSDQKRVFPLDGEHVHFIQATDKSVTSMMFEPGDANDEHLADEEVSPLQLADEQVSDFIELATGDEKAIGVDAQDEFQGDTAAGIATEAATGESGGIQIADDANDFREKIKKRLQKALLGKKK